MFPEDIVLFFFLVCFSYESTSGTYRYYVVYSKLPIHI